MAIRLKAKEYRPAGGDPYPAPAVPLRQRILLAPLGLLLAVAAYMPSWLRHGAADVLSFIARSMVRYRRRIVRQNIADCFPGKEERERRAIEKTFYRNLADYVFQTARIARRGATGPKRHVEFVGLDKIAATLDAGRDIVLYTSHFGNWEYIPELALHMPREYDGVIYAHVNRPLKNLWFNRWFHRMRSQFNTSVPMRQTARAMIGWRRARQPFIIGFLSDQKPGRYTRFEEVDFLGRRTPFIAGTEDLARKLKCAVYYTDVRRQGRDRFRVEMVSMSDDASAEPEGKLTESYAHLLDSSIRRDPASYLWSHNKWRLPKRKKQ